MLTRRFAPALLGFVLLSACGVDPEANPTTGVLPVATPGPIIVSPTDDGTTAHVPSLSEVREDVPRAAPPPEEEQSSAATTLGIDRWSCGDLVAATEGRLRRLAGDVEAFEAAFCYVHNGTGSGEFFAPADGRGPWQAGVLYPPPGIDATDLHQLDLQQVLRRGGVLLAVDFDIVEGAIPTDSDPDDPDGGYLAARAEGEPAVLRRTASGLLLGVWFAGSPGERVRGTLMTGLDEGQAMDFMTRVEPGTPRGEAPDS